MAEKETKKTAAAAAEGAEELTLHKPMADGREKLILDFDKITGRVLIDCEKQARKLDPAISVLQLSQIYQALVGAKAAHIRYDEALDLSGKDFSALCMKAQAFLLQ